MIKDLRIEAYNAIKVFKDNTTCIHMAVMEKMRNISKHVDIKYHNVKEAIKEKQSYSTVKQRETCLLYTSPSPRD